MANPGILAFSTTPANNGSGVTGVNFAEQQAPSTLNDSSRALMARIAYWRDLLAGNVTQGGSSNAYTVTTGESYTAYSNGLRLLWKPNATSSGAVTLNVDGIGAKKVFRPDGTQAGSGDILSGTLLDVVYVSTLDSAAGGFQIVGGISEATAISMSGQYKLLGRATAGAGLSEEIASSANMFALIGAADYAAARALLDLEAGTDFYSKTAADAAFQPKAANLTTWAGVTPSSNGQSLVSAADYAAMRSLLSLGTAALKNTGTSGDAVAKTDGANTWSAGQTISTGAANVPLALDATSSSYQLFKVGGVNKAYVGTDGSSLSVLNGAASAIFGINLTTGAASAGGVAIPTISSSDTLSNKTLSNPALSGTVAGAPTWSSAQVFPTGTAIGAGSGAAQLNLNGASGSFQGFKLQVAGVDAWAIGRQVVAADGAVDFYNSTNGINALKLLTNGDVEIYASPATLATNSAGFRGLGSPAEKGAGYTFAIGDAGVLQMMNDSASNAFTIPPNSSVAFPKGTVIPLQNLHATGVATVVEGAGVTLRRGDGVSGTGTRTLGNNGAYASLVKYDTNVWYITGVFT